MVTCECRHEHTSGDGRMSEADMVWKICKVAPYLKELEQET